MRAILCLVLFALAGNVHAQSRQEAINTAMLQCDLDEAMDVADNIEEFLKAKQSLLSAISTATKEPKSSKIKGVKFVRKNGKYEVQFKDNKELSSLEDAIRREIRDAKIQLGKTWVTPGVNFHLPKKGECGQLNLGSTSAFAFSPMGSSGVPYSNYNPIGSRKPLTARVILSGDEGFLAETYNSGMVFFKGFPMDDIADGLHVNLETYMCYVEGPSETKYGRYLTVSCLTETEIKEAIDYVKSNVKDRNPYLREFSSDDGKFKIRATFVEVIGKEALLKKEDDSTIKVPIAKFSKEDRQWIQENK